MRFRNPQVAFPNDVVLVRGNHEDGHLAMTRTSMLVKS